MSRKQLAYLEMSLAMVAVGSSFISGRLVTERFPLALAMTLRFGLASLVLVPLMLRGGWPAVARRDGVTLGFQALTGVVGFNVFLLLGLRYTTASESGIVMGTTPAVIGLIAFFVLRERLGGYRVAGIALAVCGIAAISVAGGGGERGANPALGNALIFGTVICEALFALCGKLLSGRLRPMVISAGVILIGLAGFLPVALWQLRAFSPGEVGTKGWLAIIYYAAGPTVVAYLLWYDGLSHVPASSAGILTGIMPVSAVVLAALILGESLRVSHLVGVACVLAALVMTLRGERQDAGSAVAKRGDLGGEDLVVEARELELSRGRVGVEGGLAGR